MNNKKIELTRMVCFLICIAVFVFFAWHSDDAYHAYIMAKNLVEGNGFVYNIGERVNASTCPLFTLCVALIYFFIRNMFLSGLIAGILFSSLAAYIAIYKVAKTEKHILFATVSMVFSACFVSFTTAGLENSLLYFFAAVFYYVFFTNETYTSKQLFVMGLMVGLTGITRMDAVLFFVIPVCYVYLFKRKNCSFVKCVGIGIGALSPFVLWELFSLFYYGFFIPNTAFAKLNTGIATIEYIDRGFWFIGVSWLYDILLFVVPTTYIVLCFLKMNLKHMLTVVSLVIYFLYVLYIGGDFMVGRHLTVLYFIAVLGCIMCLRQRKNDTKLSMMVLGLTCVAVVVNFMIPNSYVDKYMYGGELCKVGGRVTDERKFYSTYTGLINNLKYLRSDEEVLVKDTWHYLEVPETKNEKGIILSFAPGILVYYENKDIYMVDPCALADPLMSKLPVRYFDDWTVGHVWRDIPGGYEESLATMTNQIHDEALRQYYDELLFIIRGDLFSMDRIKTIIKMNLGYFDYLLEDYCQRYGV